MTTVGRVGGIARTALGGIAWDPSLHPRDHRGRFTDAPYVVTPGGTRGRAVSQVGDVVTLDTPNGMRAVPATGLVDVSVAYDRVPTQDPNQGTLFGDDFPDPLDVTLVNYKPDRSLADPTQVTRLTSILPDAEYVPYSQVPFLDALHERMGLDHGAVTRIVDSGDTDAVERYLDRRQAMFDTLPLSTVPLDQVVVTQPTVNAARVQQIIDRPETGGTKPLFFVRSGGRTYVMNGHHRIAAMLRQGDTEATGRVLDLDADPSTPAGYTAEYLRYRALTEKAKAGVPGVTWDDVNALGDHLLSVAPPAGFTGQGLRADGQPYGSGWPAYDPRHEPWYDQYVEDLEARISGTLHPAGNVTTGSHRTVPLTRDPDPHGGVVVGKQWDTQAKHVSRTRTGNVRIDSETHLPVYHLDRARLHDQIVAEVLADAEARGVPKDRQAVFMAGPSGAGKSTAIAQHGPEFGVTPGRTPDGAPDPEHPANYVVLNPDLVKERMVQLGMMDPEFVGGMSPDEAVTFIHEESSDITKMIRSALWEQGYNILVDGVFAASAKDPDKKKKEVLEYASHGYTSVGVLLDGTLDNSYIGAGRRHRQVPSTPGGRLAGRYIPYVTLNAQAPTGAVSTVRVDAEGNPVPFRSYNAETFEGAVDEFARQWVYEVSGGRAYLRWTSADAVSTKALAREGKSMEEKAGGADRNRGGAEKLRRYWTHGAGAAKIGWGTPGDWKRCVAHLSKHMGPRAKGYCQLRHREATGVYTGSRLNPGNAKGLPRLDDWIQVKADPSAPTGGHDTGGVDTVMVAFYVPAHAAVELEPMSDRAAGDLHVTLAVLATPASQMEPTEVDRLLDLVEGFAAESLDIVGAINGAAALRTGDGTANVLLLDSPDLPAFHGDLCDALDDAGFTRSDAHGFTPHITLNIDGDPAPEPPDIPVVFGVLSVAVGDEVWDFPLAADDGDVAATQAEEAPPTEATVEQKGRPLIDVLADFIPETSR